MHTTDQCFTPFNSCLDAYSLPENFTFPFCYEPHPLCKLAAEQLQQHLLSQTQWQHDFGLTNIRNNYSQSSGVGKMFGVLIVENTQGELGFLSAFSGKIADQNLLPHFVPPVFDMLAKDSFFHAELDEITEINTQVTQLKNDAEFILLKEQIAQLQQSAEQQIETQRKHIIDGRKRRKAQRSYAEESMSSELLTSLLDDLSRQSVFEKNQLKDLKAHWQLRIEEKQQALDVFENKLKFLQRKRKKRSSQLQKKLFAQYQFLNKDKQRKDLNEIFAQTAEQVPPAGAGECAAPKLLQYAFTWGMRPIAMAEFWWGVSPKSAIRQHKKFYASCSNKCQPILGHMLNGIKLDENPLLINTGEGKHIEIIYQDEHMLVINKPEDLLSVPGKNIQDSVYSRIKILFPQAKGPLIVHRLDMSTSGLMVIALTVEANKRLQRQFITRCVKKRYVAVIEGELEQDEGLINLPLRQDLDDRPRQMVCYEHGKNAETTWQVIERQANRTKLYLYPKTGRTHQLRMHCAHSLGLNMPIVGDDLYGIKTNRLHLHAQRLELAHPISRELLVFEIDANF